MTQRSIQEIFNIALENPRYYPDSLSIKEGMCSAIDAMFHDKIIERGEWEAVKRAISDYLTNGDMHEDRYLYRGLIYAGIVELELEEGDEMPKYSWQFGKYFHQTIEATTAIYRDWANRPSLRNVVWKL